MFNRYSPRTARLGLRRSALLLILVVALAACGGGKKESSGSASQPADATLDIQSDRVEREDATSQVWSPVTGPQMVRSNDGIRTDVTGHAVLTFYTGTQVEIMPSSELVVTDYERTADGGATITLKQLSGETLHRVQLLANTQSHYEVNTPVAHLLVRGTEFGVTVAADGATHVEVKSGVVHAEIGLQQVDISPGQAIDINANMVPGPLYTIPAILPPASLQPFTPTPPPSLTPIPFQGGQPTTAPTPVPFVPSPTSTEIPPIGVAAPTETLAPFPNATLPPAGQPGQAAVPPTATPTDTPTLELQIAPIQPIRPVLPTATPVIIR
ncbi:MAG TPA: FecR family protein [Aggregatilineaceae bacterium]|nr:FecR family protein [Aggregatilineaceae bacterium]